ncbi:MAG: hypothetical protein LBT89_09935 [Planctomycetaceae bacterium]|jgi:hypothetical protein|nr:hypothetical protein [Planctomycetaceae bacterium]
MFRNFFVLMLLAAPVFAADVVCPARQYSSCVGNYVGAESRWDNLGVLHSDKGSVTWQTNIADAGTYYIQFLYASQKTRPANITLIQAGQTHEFKSVLAEPTGGFFAEHLKWTNIAPNGVKLVKGQMTLTLAVDKYMPHLRGFRITAEKELPADAGCFAQIETAEEQARWALELQTMTENRKHVQQIMPDVQHILFIKRATFQSSHYYTDFIDGSLIFGTELCLLNLKDGSVKNLVPSLASGIIGRCNLSFDAKKVIFDYKAKVGEGYRIWEVGIDGSNLKQLTFPPADEEERIAKYRMDKNNKISQTWANYRGHGAGVYFHHTDDMHPAYLPDGGFVFTSSRCEYGILCDGPDVLTVSVLYRAYPDGKLEKLSNNALSESCPTVMEDGRILYTRWEYVDNGSVTNKGLWAINPDGTASFEIYGANIAYPSVFNTARQIPGESAKFVCIGAPHMPVGLGPVLLVDTRYNRRTVDGVRYVTPDIDQQDQWGWKKPIAGQKFVRLFEPESVRNACVQVKGAKDDHSGRGNTDKGPLFMDPFPINEHEFLVSYNPDKRWNAPNGYGLYYINDSGVREPLYRAPHTSLWCPIPVKAVKTPGMPSVARNPELAAKGLARLVVVDVYAGMDGVKRGTVKYLRINEHVPRPWSARRYWDGDEYDQQHSVITMNAHLGLKAQYGIVPVETDGSANFVVPADKNIFIQALDENYREIQRERTFVNYRPGEIRSCVGCHERASESPTVGSGKAPMALRRPSSVPGPQPGEVSGARPLSYFEDVQPVLDRHCVECHKAGKAEGNINLEGTLTGLFNRSYETLMKWKPFTVIGENHPKGGNNHYLPPYSLGSYESKLVKLLDKGHYEVKMPKEDWIKLTTWVDSNGQYYGTYFGHKNLKYKDLPDFRRTPAFEEIETALPQIR